MSKLNYTIPKNSTVDVKLDHLKANEKELLSMALSDFLDSVSTATSRATFYNSKEEQENALDTIHNELFQIDRGIFSAALLLPGSTDYSIQKGILRLLFNPNTERSVIDYQTEGQIIEYLSKQLTVPRMLKLFLMIKEKRVNNSRTRKLLLRSILREKNLELWSTKYKQKLKDILVHAWGKRMSGIIQSILNKDEYLWNKKERDILDENILKYCGPLNQKAMFECVKFIFGNENNLTLPLLKAYSDAKHKLKIQKLMLISKTMML